MLYGINNCKLSCKKNRECDMWVIENKCHLYYPSYSYI